MTAGDAARDFGFDSLMEVSLLSGVSVGTLRNWHINKPQVFKTIMLGAWYLKCNL